MKGLVSITQPVTEPWASGLQTTPDGEPLVSVRFGLSHSYITVRTAADAQKWIDAFVTARTLLIEKENADVRAS